MGPQFSSNLRLPVFEDEGQDSSLNIQVMKEFASSRGCVRKLALVYKSIFYFYI